MAHKFDVIKKELLARKKELEDLLVELSKDNKPDTEAKDLGDHVSASTLESLRLSLENAEFEEYKAIISALKAIDDGSYGICVDCGEEISPQRLQVYPNASRCIRCQELSEF